MLRGNSRQFLKISAYSLNNKVAQHSFRYFTTTNIRMSHYDVLGIKNTASPLEIKSAYYAKVKQLHPDTNHSTSAEEDFKIVAKAYETLKDPSLKEIYDARLKTGTQFANETTYSSYSNNTYNPYAEFYARKPKSNNEDDAFSYSSSWGYNKSHHQHRTEEEFREKYYRQAYSSSIYEQKSALESLAVRILIVLGIYGMIDIWRRTHKRPNNPHGIIHAGAPLSVGQMDFETFTGWGRDDVSTPEKLYAEIKKKGFRIEYHDLNEKKGDDAKKKVRACTRSRKIENMDKFLAKRNFHMQKSKSQ